MGSGIVSKGALFGGMAVVVLMASGVRGQERTSLKVERVRLADGIYLFRAPSDLDKWTSTNSVVIVGDDGVIVFDSNTLPGTTHQVLAGIRELTSLPVRLLINSHWHMDHWSGNEVYADTFPGVQILSTYETRNFMARMPAPFFVDEVGLERSRARLDSAIRSGRLADGSSLTPERRRSMEADVRETAEFASEVAAIRRVLPTMMYSDSLTLTMSGRKLQMIGVTGDAAGSTILYLPDERILITGDVLVRQENGAGAQPWTMNSFAVSRWLEALRRLETFDAAIIVPGQGPALHDATYLHMTRQLYEELIRQTHAALEQGAVKLSDVRSRVDVNDLGRRFTNGDAVLNERFEAVVMVLIRKIIQEAHDGITPPT